MSRVTVTPEMTRKVAKLSRLSLTDEEVSLFSSQLGEIVSYVEKLAEVATDGVEPLLTPFSAEEARAQPTRQDVVRLSADSHQNVLDSAPDVQHGGFKVPKIV